MSLTQITPPRARAYCIEAIDKKTALKKTDELLINLFCLNRNGCGECAGCKKFLARSHPNALFIDGGKEEAKTDNLRKTVIPFVSDTFSDKEYKAVVITDADMLHIAAQNAMLKMLEEPPPRVIFVLTTSKKRKLLPTVLSRCIILKARTSSENPLEELSAEFDLEKSQARILFDAAQKDIYYAEKLAQSDYFKIRDNMIEALDKLWSLKTFATSRTEHLICGEEIQSEKDKTAKLQKVSAETVEKNLEIALIYIRDVLNYKYRADAPANADRIEDIKKHARLDDLKLTLTADKFAEFIQKMALCKGLNVKLGITSTLFDILEAVI